MRKTYNKIYMQGILECSLSKKSIVLSFINVSPSEMCIILFFLRGVCVFNQHLKKRYKRMMKSVFCMEIVGMNIGIISMYVR